MNRRRASVGDGPPSEVDVAYHETGHALIATALGYELHRVTIVPDESGALGRCTLTGRGRTLPALVEFHLACSDRRARQAARMAMVREALYTGGGYAAEALLTEKPRWRMPFLVGHADRHSDPADWHKALTAAAANRWENAERGAAWCGALLHRYMVARRPMLDDLAALLVRERTVEGEAFADAIFESAERHGADLFEAKLFSSWWASSKAIGGGR